MRRAFTISFIANLILALASLFPGPLHTVAIHFGPGGQPNGWAPAYVNALIISGVNVLLFVSFFFAPRLIRSTPASVINLPNKDYWLKEGNRIRMESMLTAHLYQFGTLTLVLMFSTGLLALQANLSTPVHFREDLFIWPFGLYIAYTIYWVIKLTTAFDLPEE